MYSVLYYVILDLDLFTVNKDLLHPGSIYSIIFSQSPQCKVQLLPVHVVHLHITSVKFQSIACMLLCR